jgi:hypothetical protein
MFPFKAFCLRGFRGAEGEKPGSQNADLTTHFGASLQPLCSKPLLDQSEEYLGDSL